MDRVASSTSSTRVSAIITCAVVALGVAIVVVGLRFLLDPAAAASSFGVPARPDDPAYLAAKGVRDIVSGLSGLTPFALGYRRAAGWFLIVIALVPVGDAVIVSTYGSIAFALGVHGVTAVVLAVVGVALVKAGEKDPAH